jgi:DNA-binding NarL/FixJ family response regulator
VSARTLVLVDDQPEFLSLARRRLSRQPGLAVIGEALGGAALLDLLPRLEPPPDAVLLDVEMPDLDGLETARRVRTLAPRVRIILISAFEERRYEALADALGASFLPKRLLTTDAILQRLDAATPPPR